MSEFKLSSEIPAINSSKYTKEQIERFSKNVLFTDYDNKFVDHLDFRIGRAEREPGNENLIEELKKRLNGKDLIDLGCGPEILWDLNDSVKILEAGKSEEELPPLIKLLRKTGIKSYTGVDFSNKFYREVPESILKGNEWTEHLSTVLGFEVKLVYDEMLRYIHTLPDGSSCYTMNGITPELFIDDEQNYTNALIDELGRTMASDGVIFGTESTFLHQEKFDEVGLKPLNDNVSDFLNFYVYVKE